MKPHESMRLSPDCSGKRFKALRVSMTAPSGAYLKYSSQKPDEETTTHSK